MSEVKPIYSANDKRHFLIRWGERIFAIVMTIIMWIFIAITLHNKLYIEVGDGFWHVIDIMVLGGVAAVIVLGIWQWYNWILYHGKSRRKEFKHHSLHEVGALYGISAEDMARLLDVRKAAVVEFRDHRYYYCLDDGVSIEITSLRKNSDKADK